MSTFAVRFTYDEMSVIQRWLPNELEIDEGDIGTSEDFKKILNIQAKFDQAELVSIPEIGDYINTPRFLRVRIHAVFALPEDATACGYTEPTHLYDLPYQVLGKNAGLNKMRFAAVLSNPLPER